MSVFSRIRQGWVHLFGRLSEPERAWVEEVLSPREWSLFDRMHRADQFHGCRVARMLALQDPPLYVLKAALLHDCGKPHSFGLIARTFAVLVGSEIKREHPRWGAAKLEGILAPEGVELVRHHHGEASLPWLPELQEADSLN